MVTYTPTSVPTYTIDGSSGSTSTAFTGAFGRLFVTFCQVLPASVLPYSVGTFDQVSGANPLPPNPAMPTYTVLPVVFVGSTAMDDTRAWARLKICPSVGSFVTVLAVRSLHVVEEATDDGITSAVRTRPGWVMAPSPAPASPT